MAGPIIKKTIVEPIVDLTKPIVSNILKETTNILKKSEGRPKKIDESTIVKEKSITSDKAFETAEGASQLRRCSRRSRRRAPKGAAVPLAAGAEQMVAASLAVLLAAAVVVVASLAVAVAVATGLAVATVAEGRLPKSRGAGAKCCHGCLERVLRDFLPHRQQWTVLGRRAASRLP